jgi:HAMP domain-containing protein
MSDIYIIRHQITRMILMTERSIFLATAASIAAFVFVLELVRRRRLSEEYSLLWLFTAFAMMVVSAWRDLLHGIAAAVGIVYPPNLLFLLAALFMLAILLYFSTVITRLTRENKDIAQHVALMQYEIERLSAQLEQKASKTEHSDEEEHAPQPPA